MKTRQSKQCRFDIYTFDNSKSKSMVRLVRSEKMSLSGLVFARKIATRQDDFDSEYSGSLMINMAYMPLYMWEMWDVTPVTDGRTDEQWKVVQYSVWAESAKEMSKQLSSSRNAWRWLLSVTHTCDHMHILAVLSCCRKEIWHFHIGLCHNSAWTHSNEDFI